MQYYAYQRNNGEIDIETISETEEDTKQKTLQGLMGWKYNHPSRYDREVNWQVLLSHGKIITVQVTANEHIDTCKIDDAYNEIIRKRQKLNTPMAVGKHTAANAGYCDKVIENLREAGCHAEADWAIWMLWWRISDRQTQQQIDEQRQEEITNLQQEVEDIKKWYMNK